MTMAGRLAGTLDGRPWSCDAEASVLTVKLAGIGSALTMRRCWPQMSRIVRPLTSVAPIRVRARIGFWPAVTVLPSSGALGRWLLPD